MSLPDVQQMEPNVKIKLNRVGISKLVLPILIRRKESHDRHPTNCTVSCYVDLEESKKGINMSRLPIIIQENAHVPLKKEIVKIVAQEIMQASNAELCQLIYEFDYFTIKQAPVTKLEGYLNHKVIFNGIYTKNDFHWEISVETIGTSLCPCSKEISNAGAHNQKCYINISVIPKQNKIVWIEDLINIADKSCSCEIWSVLKRLDEKYVTEAAYNNPMFVEDIARECYKHLIQNENVDKFKVKVASDESIHVHRAEAIIEAKR